MQIRFPVRNGHFFSASEMVELEELSRYLFSVYTEKSEVEGGLFHHLRGRSINKNLPRTLGLAFRGGR